MLIAIDYDRTFSADPALWCAFIKNAQQRGHGLCCVTQRRPNEIELLPDRHIELFKKLDVRIYYTARNAKKKFLKDQFAIEPNIWIDDSPESVVNNSLWELPDDAPHRETYETETHEEIK